jgi:DNA mismatch endonuclease, patch repair protein
VADVVSLTVRSRMMAGIKGKNTKPELIIRKLLYAKGFRYRLHVKNLPGNPDIVLRRYRAVLFIHGCFWHRHDCHLFKWPKTRDEFWKNKISCNVARDEKALEGLASEGWRVLILWECATKGKARREISELTTRVASWIEKNKPSAELAGIIKNDRRKRR